MRVRVGVVSSVQVGLRVYLSCSYSGEAAEIYERRKSKGREKDRITHAKIKGNLALERWV